jgi:hypothetical protein
MKRTIGRRSQINIVPAKAARPPSELLDQLDEHFASEP